MTLTVPLSTRVANLNSTEFRVILTGEYVAIRFRKVPVEYSVNRVLFMPLDFDQLSNSEFEYLSIYRDVELYHLLWSKGYHNITTVSMSEARGTLMIQQKLVYATSGNKSVLVQVRIEGETVPLDYTTAVSRDENLLMDLRVVLDLAKVSTSYTALDQNPGTPFRVPQSSG